MCGGKSELSHLLLPSLPAGYPVPYVFLADEAQTLGFSAEASANLLVYLSSVNTVGRVMAGECLDPPFLLPSLLSTKS
ncbi:unnamed protein product [Hydatigera taeniaeformis]|uniref:DEAD domain-containing protein n=1 Tax=Hydatigena taeniaeformis TaxID=6205 RepID=A0A0R3XBH0_HYDTA|nr:unnamed protein product [Hydatigera taeniaeformis]